MSLPHFFLDAPLTQRLGWALIHSLWEGLLIALLLALALAVLRRRGPQSRYLVSCGAMVALAIAPVITFITAPPRISAASSNPITANALSPRNSRATPPNAGIGVSAAPRADSQSMNETEFPSAIGTDLPRAGYVPNRTASATHPARFSLGMVDRLSPSLPWLVLAWLAGMLALSARNINAWAGVQRLRSRNALPVASSIEHVARRLAQRLGLARRVRFLQSTLADSPLVIGVLKPAILLPASMLTELPAAQLEALLAHELAHVARHDYLVNLLQSAIETLFFYHPATWWISRRIRIEREFCCDDMAVRVTRDRSTYVRALAAVAGVRAPALAPAASGGLLLPRLRRMLALPDPQARSASPWLAGALALVLCTIAAIAPTLYAPAGEAAQQKPAIPGAPHAAEKALAIHGHVLDPDGKPVAGAEVILALSSPRNPDVKPINARSASDGSFTFSGLPRATEQTGASLNIRATGFGLAVTGASVSADNEVSLAPPTLIRVSFVDPDGKPVAGLSVRPTYLRAGQSLSVVEAGVSRSLGQRTDAQGACTFSGMPQDSELYLQIDDPRFTQLSYRDAINLTADAVSPPAIIRLKPGSGISGRVVYGPTGKPVAGIRVLAQAITGVNSFGRGEAYTDDNGNYQMTQVAAGSYNVMLVPKDNDDRAAAWTAAARERVPVGPAQNVADVNLTLIKGGLITGRVLRGDTGEAVAQTAVAMHGPAQPESSNMMGGAVTGPDGAFTLRVAPGKQSVYLQDIPPDGYDTIRASLVEVAEGQTVKMDLKLPRRPGKPVSGRVLGPDGKPLTGVVVRAELPDVRAYYFPLFQKSDEQGRFHFEALTPGTGLHADLRDLKTPLAVTVNGSEQDVTLRLVPRVRFTASGIVTDSDGKPLPNAEVQFYPAITQRIFIDTGRPNLTDATGRYTLKGLEAGARYGLTAKAAGYGPQQVRLELKPGQDKFEIDPIRLRATTHRIVGRVTQSDGRPAAGVNVELNGALTDLQETRTDAGGRFSFRVVEGATGAVYLRDPEGKPLEAKTVRADDESVELVEPAPVIPGAKAATEPAPLDSQEAAAIKSAAKAWAGALAAGDAETAKAPFAGDKEAAADIDAVITRAKAHHSLRDAVEAKFGKPAAAQFSKDPTEILVMNLDATEARSEALREADGASLRPPGQKSGGIKLTKSGGVWKVSKLPGGGPALRKSALAAADVARALATEVSEGKFKTADEVAQQFWKRIQKSQEP